MTLQPTLSDHIKNRSQEQEKAHFTGKITKVWDKTSDDANEGNLEVNVQLPNRRNEPRRMPVVGVEHAGHMPTPQPGDFALVNWMMGDGRHPVVVNIIPTDKQRSPNVRAGHWRHEFRNDNTNNLYLEAEPASADTPGDPEILRMGVKSDGLSQPDTEVAIDDSGSSTEVRIDTDGDVTINANGAVEIDGSSGVTVDTENGPKSVAYNDHTHDYEGEDTEGNTVTKQTSQPNESGTTTEIG